MWLLWHLCLGNLEVWEKVGPVKLFPCKSNQSKEKRTDCCSSCIYRGKARLDFCASIEFSQFFFTQFVPHFTTMMVLFLLSCCFPTLSDWSSNCRLWLQSMNLSMTMCFMKKKKTNYCNKYGKTFSNFMVKDISTVDLRLVYSIYTV